jgi:very-short-patch-repair endonuclease
MSRPSTPLPEWAEDPFRAKDAAARGVRKGRLRGHDLSVPYRGVRVRGVVAHTVLERCRAYSAIMAPGQFFSHQTAARIHGIPVPGREDDEPLHVCVYRPDRAPRMAGVIGHHTDVNTIDTVMREGWFVTAPAHTLLQLAGGLSVDQLVVAGDAIVRRRDPMGTLEELAALLPRAGGMRGVARLREAIALVQVGSESPMETKLRLILARGGLPEPELNTDIHDRYGRFLARGDLVYREQRVIVEYDGDQHRTDQRQYERDVDRLESLAAEGWRVIRVLRHHLDYPESVVRRVRAALAGR